ncbi:MAG: phosphonate ABC transporter ATP-binding protein [Meiothermus sp.]|nr:phosphonate ABC transporter ATP-binding protein [Meiothermus sp.]
MSHAFVRLEGITQRFPNGTVALSNIDLNLSTDKFTAMIGPSGAGKSTLMRVINGLVRPTEGKVFIGQTEISRAPEATVRQARRQIGMVFQQFNLVRRLTALENVLIGRLGTLGPLTSTLKFYSKPDRELAMGLLERVGMADYAWQRADTLSGGQQQRVGIARALAQLPKLILADEPISALDPKSSEQVMEILRSINAQDGIAVICNLHHLDTVRGYADRVVALKKGRLVFDGTAAGLSEEVSRSLYYDEQLEGPVPEAHVPRLSPA